MKSKIIILVLVLFSLSASLQAEQTEAYKNLYKSYQENYNFFSMKDSVFTIESELELPEGFSYQDDKDSTSFQYWVSHFPIWHQFKSVGLFRGGKFLEYDEISRVVHLPWGSPSFRDVSIPLRILAEFLFQTDDKFGFTAKPKKGDLLTYSKWLNGKPAFNQMSEVIFKDGLAREETDDEYYKFLIFCMQNVDYKSIARTCDSISIEDLQAGDIYIATDEKGRTGKLFIIFHVIKNSEGNKKYLVATGCPNACDLYIPKFNENRDDPWIGVKKLKNLTKEFKQSGFYRLKTTRNDNKQ